MQITKIKMNRNNQLQKDFLGRKLIVYLEKIQKMIKITNKLHKRRFLILKIDKRFLIVKIIKIKKINKTIMI